MTEQNNKAINIRKIRERLNLNQEELAYLVGISAVYLSQIETGNRQLNYDTANKIAYGFSWLCTPRDSEPRLDQEGKKFLVARIPVKPSSLLVHHIASFYPEELQEKILKLLNKKYSIENELNYIFDNKELPPESFYRGHVEDEMPEPPFCFFFIEEFKNKVRDEVLVDIRENVQFVKDKFAERTKGQPAYQKNKSFFEEFPSFFEEFPSLPIA